jgi:uncharacterized BrkB/YihY/UPF0761 family membrane protein
MSSTPTKQSISTLVGLAAYLLVVLAMPVGKTVHLAILAKVSWLKATCLLWGPWVLLVAFVTLALLYRVVRAQFQKEPAA